MGKILKIRASSLGKIMSKPVGGGGGLSVGAKTYIKSLAKMDVYGYAESFRSKYTDKGTICEDDSILLYNDRFMTDYEKNDEWFQDEYVCGTPDIICRPASMVVDIKTSWSLATFPAIAADAHDNDYEWQVRAYMRLTGCTAAQVAFCLVDTPPELVSFEDSALHIVSQIPAHLRVTVVDYVFDSTANDLIESKVMRAREFYDECLSNILSEHQE